MALINSPPDAPMDEARMTGPIFTGWRNFFIAVFNILSANTQSGLTADRPTKMLWIGRRYYDTTLGIPIWVNAVTPAVVWHNAAGGVV